MSGDFDFEPIRGIPAGLPEGERILWQGAPDGWAFAKTALHIRGLAFYFGLLMAWRFGVTLYEGGGIADGLVAAAWTLPLAVLVLGLVFGYAYMVHRTTVYSITTERVVVRAGVAFTVTATIPFGLIRSADMAIEPDGTGMLVLDINRDQRVSWVMFWPHVRPWRITHPQPAFRAIRAPEAAAAVLANALSAHARQQTETVSESEAAADPVASGGEAGGRLQAAAHDKTPERARTGQPVPAAG